MNRRHTDRMPSPFFRAVVYALVTLIVLLVSIFSNIAQAAERAVAPVIEATGKDGVRVQIGWYEYEREDGVVVLYCVPTGDTTLSCAVYVATPKGNAVVIVDGVTATEIAS